MLFNSFEFIFGFLPIAWLGWWLVKKTRGFDWAIKFLILTSVFFYGYWKISYLPLLLLSVFANFFIAGRTIKTVDKPSQSWWFASGVLFNVLALGYFKYAHFLTYNISMVLGDSLTVTPEKLLPLGISFITFQKIAYLSDCRRGIVRSHNLRDYLFFVTFFPQLIAGPIVHHKELIDQIHRRPQRTELQQMLVAAILLFSIGLFKKVVIADSLAGYADPVFDAARSQPIGYESAWKGMLAYTLQLYFDFSGYTDMALGLGLLFGIKLPVNFDSPYKAVSIVEFWRRWNMTLSGFLRDYIYIPLGGRRCGQVHRGFNLFVTMLVGGLWHGAGWTFVMWGAYHGALLMVFHWLASGFKFDLGRAKYVRAPMTVLTFFLVAFGWVLFRSESLSAAANMFAGLFQFFDPSIFGGLQLTLITNGALNDWLPIYGALLLVWFSPNSLKLSGYRADFKVPRGGAVSAKGFYAGLLMMVSIKVMVSSPSTEFLYFQF